MDRVFATYLIETPLPLQQAAEVLAGEQSSGTFVAVPGETAELRERFGAFEALMSGDAPRHDATVARALQELSSRVDVIVLAQASMARVVDGLTPEERGVPILASPALAVDYLATVL